jgi:hypothetical protein
MIVERPASPVLPHPACIEEQPTPFIGAKKNRIALPYVENVKLDLAGVRQMH